MFCVETVSQFFATVSFYLLLYIITFLLCTCGGVWVGGWAGCVCTCVGVVCQELTQ